MSEANGSVAAAVADTPVDTAPAAEGVQVMVIPPPTANGPLHVGHLSGPFLAADVAARAARSRGERVLAVGGVDVHQNYVLTRAQNENADPWRMVAGFREQIADAYARGRLHADVEVDPTDAQHRAVVAELLLDLVERGVVPMREMTLHRCADCARTLHHSYVAGICSTCGSGANGGSCEGCGGFTSAQTLRDLRCDRCGGAAEEFRATVPVLDLDTHRDRLVAHWVGGALPRRFGALANHYLATGLPSLPLAYPTDWGVECHGRLSGLRMDVYFEVAASTLVTVARGLRGDPARNAADVRAACTEVGRLWHFNGIDNAFYVALLWPAVYLLLGLDVEQLGGAVANEFYTLDGLKFSTSRNHAVWADELLATQDPDLVRLYLCWDRPGEYSSDFTMAGYTAFAEWARPLLDRRGVILPEELIDGQLARAEFALRPEAFDVPLAARALLTAAAAGADRPAWKRVHAALTGIEAPV